MLQTGTFYTAVNNENSTETKRALANIFIYFSQNGARKLTTKTDTAGKFSFDLPLGDYQVTISQGANFSVHSLAGGATFSLTSTSKADEFEKWVMTPITINPEDNPLVIRLAALAKIASDAATEAKAISDQMNGNSDGMGLFVRQSAVKINALKDGGKYYTPTNTPPKLVAGDSGLSMAPTLSANNPGLDFAGISQTWIHFYIQANYVDSSRLVGFFNGYGTSDWFVSSTNADGVWSKPSRFYGTHNTIVDSNGNLKAASPVLRLFNDRIETNDQFAEEPVFEKIGVGKYKISNTLGLAQEGWTYEKPRGSDGQPYFRIVVDKLEDGCIVTVHDEYDDYESVEITDIDGNKRTVTKQTKVLSAPRDIKEHERWIDLRFCEESQELADEELLPQLDNRDESAH